MTTRKWLLVLSILASAALLQPLIWAQVSNLPDGPSADEPAPAISWKKTVLDRKFRSEGVAIADVNKDGKMDILAGDIWYEAPDWKVHEIRKVGDYDLSNYSECMLCWADDVNGDGWPDQIVIGFPGKAAYWYENPKGQE